MADTRRTVLCLCGGDVYEKTLDDTLQPIWKCDNCGRETPRKRVSRKSNRSRAITAYLAVKETWKPVDDALDALVSSGKAMGGALLVHSSTFNYHLRKLADTDKPSNFDIRYHAEQAKKDMAAAQAFVEERSAS